MHIYDFITDIEQSTLKKASQHINKDNAFEDVLSSYHQLFMQKLGELSIKDEPKHLGPKLKADENVQKWLSELLELVNLEKNSGRIDELFKDLQNIYLVFISGKHQIAVSLFYHLLEKHNLLDEAYSESLGSFLRIRLIRAGDDPSKEEYYYHIPFNKRFLIKNQRFSFSGIPILYAGESLIASYYEMGLTNLNDKQYGIAVFGYDHLANIHRDHEWQFYKRRNRIFDISNSLYDLVNDLFFEALERGLKVNSIRESTNFPPKIILRAFKKLILSHVCTFVKIQHVADQHFIEEYVLPQLLTESVRLHKYDGIIYPSTRFDDKKIEFEAEWHSSIYKTNIALFSNYTPGKFYDDELMKNYVPHVADLSKIEEENAFKFVEELAKNVRVLENFLLEKPPISELRGRFLIQLWHLQKKIKLYEGITIEDEKYLNTYAGKVEAKYLEEYFRYVHSLVRRVYDAEYEKQFG